MQEVIISLIILFIFLIVILIYHQINSEKRLRSWLKDTYGKKPPAKAYDLEKISCYWEQIKSLIPEDEMIDDITWNDLEMNHIFKRINRCHTFAGEHVLFARLHCLAKNDSKLQLLEEKINYLSENSKEREDIQVLLCRLGKEEGAYSLPMFLNNLDIVGIPFIWIYRILQIALVIPVAIALIMQNPSYLIASGGLLLCNLTIYTFQKMKYEGYLESLNSIIGLVKVSDKIVNDKNISYETRFHDLKKETEVFNRLSHMIGTYQRKKEAAIAGSMLGIVVDYLIGATFWDFIKYNQIVRILQQNQTKFMDLYARIGEIDMAITVASFRKSLPHYCLPSFQKEATIIMEDIYHPLIDAPVCNSVSLDQSCILTGSNASGKSTFIKAAAINALLAQSIHTCMAKRMVLPFARIITSMAVRDDLMAGESYYIKEIKYLKRIIDNIREDHLVLCCIDEILRGTNTEERIAASAAILRYLSKQNCIAIVASHDAPLTKMMEGRYSNYHFREQIREKDIMFDYKIREGASNSKNAIKLLEYVDFPTEIIKDARSSAQM